MIQEDWNFFHKENTISILQVLKERTLARKPLSSFYRMIFAVSCRRLFIQDHAQSNSCYIVFAELVKGTQQHGLLGNVEDRQEFCRTTVSILLASSDECYEVSAGSVEIS